MVVKQATEENRNVVAVCASTQGEGTVPIDKNGNVLHPALLWLDMRGQEMIRKQIGSGLFRVAGYDAGKLFRWIRLTGGAPSLSGKDPAAHMLFFKQELPRVYAQTYKFLNVLDYVNYRLSARVVATPDSILTSWVTNNRDPNNVSYDTKLIRWLGLDREKLPEIVRSTDIIGPLHDTVAADIGLPGGIPVVGGTIDTSAAAVGSGAVLAGQAHLYIGTSSWIGAHVTEKRTDLSSQIASVPCALPDRFLMIAMQSAAGSNLAFLKDHVFFNRDELSQEEEPPDVYGLIDKIAHRAPAGSRGVIYTPWLFGERTPVDNPSVRAGLLNLSMQHTREDIVRAVLEGVALNTRWMLRPVKKFLNKHPLEELAIVGGGGSSDVWCQIFADVMNVRIRQLESPLQANLLGSTFVAGVGIGALGFQDVSQRVRTKQVYRPQECHRAVYDAAFDAYCDCYRRLAPVYRRVNRSRKV